MRRVQEAEALEATKARILSARHAEGGSGDGGAPGMLIDKPGEGVEEQEDSVPADQSQDGLDATAKTTKSALQRKTKQQRRKAEKLRAEVCGLNLTFVPSFSSSVKKKHYSRNVPSWSAPCGNGCMRLSTLSRLYAMLLKGREWHE